MATLDLAHLIAWAQFPVTNFGITLHHLDHFWSEKSQLWKTSYRVLLHWTLVCAWLVISMLPHSFVGKLPGATNLFKQLAFNSYVCQGGSRSFQVRVAGTLGLLNQWGTPKCFNLTTEISHQKDWECHKVEITIRPCAKCLPSICDIIFTIYFNSSYLLWGGGFLGSQSIPP